MSSQKEIERNARKAAIEAMTAELLGSNPMDLYKQSHQSIPASAEENQDFISDQDDRLLDSHSLFDDKAISVASSKEAEPSFSPSSPSSSSSSNKDDQSAQAPQPSSNKSLNLDEYAEANKIPVSHQADLKGHSKAVMTLSVDTPGNRVVTGSLDYQTKIYDFGGMDSRFRAFTSFEPSEGHPVISVCHSPHGDRFILGTGSCQPKVFDRDGNLIITFVRGDMYIRDMTNTKGHTMEVTGVYWHPTEANTVISTSLDGTMRIWDLLGEAVFGNLVNKHVLKIRSIVAAATSQTRIGGTCCTMTSNGKYYIAGASDGTIHIWQDKRAYSRPDIVIKSAHGIGSTACVVRSVIASSDGSKLFSRGEDELIKLWDLKKPSAPLKVFSSCPNPYPTANIALSPDNKFMMCGVSSSANAKAKAKNASENNGDASEQSALLLFDLSLESTSPCMRLSVPDIGSIIFVRWVASTNQILCR
jgi:WD repeat-containing protein 70